MRCRLRCFPAAPAPGEPVWLSKRQLRRKTVQLRHGVSKPWGRPSPPPSRHMEGNNLPPAQQLGSLGRLSAGGQRPAGGRASGRLASLGARASMNQDMGDQPLNRSNSEAPLRGLWPRPRSSAQTHQLRHGLAYMRDPQTCCGSAGRPRIGDQSATRHHRMTTVNCHTDKHQVQRHLSLLSPRALTYRLCRPIRPHRFVCPVAKRVDPCVHRPSSKARIMHTDGARTAHPAWIDRRRVLISSSFSFMCGKSILNSL